MEAGRLVVDGATEDGTLTSILELGVTEHGSQASAIVTACGRTAATPVRIILDSGAGALGLALDDRVVSGIEECPPSEP
jgi:hypothetical protein